MYLEETVASKVADPPKKKNLDISQPWAVATCDTDTLDLFGKVSQFLALLEIDHLLLVKFGENHSLKICHIKN